MIMIQLKFTWNLPRIKQKASETSTIAMITGMKGQCKMHLLISMMFLMSRGCHNLHLVEDEEVEEDVEVKEDVMEEVVEVQVAAVEVIVTVTTIMPMMVLEIVDKVDQEVVIYRMTKIVMDPEEVEEDQVAEMVEMVEEAEVLEEAVDVAHPPQITC